jgi:microcin C transport system permease protein
VTALKAILVIVLVVAAGYIVAHKLLPRAVRGALGLFGIRPKLTPLMAKRVRRFKSIRRGYYAFLFVTSLFTASLFLEMLVNDEALVIHRRGKYAFPAVREWAGKWVPVVAIPHFLRGDEWGLGDPGRIDYRRYDAPGIAARIAREEKARDEARARFAAMARPVALAPPVAPREPPASATPDEREEYAFDLEMYEIELADYQKNYEKVRADHERRVREHEFLERDLGAREGTIAALRELETDLERGDAWVVMPFYPYGPEEHILDIAGDPPYRPGQGGLLLGATDNGRDVFVQLAYGFRLSILFALLVAAIGETVGVLFGGIMGYYGGTVDIAMQRFVEIWQSIPFLFTLMILASIIQPGVVKLAALLIVLRAWIGITYTIRGEFYREKAKDYVQAAIAMGASDWKIITRHILPNSLVPVVSFAPFAIVGYISVLVSLDYLGFGLPPGTPSWGYLLKQGHDYLISYPHLIIVPSLALAATLFCVVIIGESVREAFDPKVFSRLR